MHSTKAMELSKRPAFLQHSLCRQSHSVAEDANSSSLDGTDISLPREQRTSHFCRAGREERRENGGDNNHLREG